MVFSCLPQLMGLIAMTQFASGDVQVHSVATNSVAVTVPCTPSTTRSMTVEEFNWFYPITLELYRGLLSNDINSYKLVTEMDCEGVQVQDYSVVEYNDTVYLAYDSAELNFARLDNCVFPDTLYSVPLNCTMSPLCNASLPVYLNALNEYFDCSGGYAVFYRVLTKVQTLDQLCEIRNEILEQDGMKAIISSTGLSEGECQLSLTSPCFSKQGAGDVDDGWFTVSSTIKDFGELCHVGISLCNSGGCVVKDSPVKFHKFCHEPKCSYYFCSATLSFLYCSSVMVQILVWIIIIAVFVYVVKTLLTFTLFWNMMTFAIFAQRGKQMQVFADAADTCFNGLVPVISDQHFSQSPVYSCTQSGFEEVCDITVTLDTQLVSIPGSCNRYALTSLVDGNAIEPVWIDICTLQHFRVLNLDYQYTTFDPSVETEVYGKCLTGTNGRLKCNPFEFGQITLSESKESEQKCGACPKAEVCGKAGIKPRRYYDVFEFRGSNEVVTQFAVRLVRNGTTISEYCSYGDITESSPPFRELKVHGSYQTDPITLPGNTKIVSPHGTNSFYSMKMPERYTNAPGFGSYQVDLATASNQESWYMPSDNIKIDSLRCSGSKYKANFDIETTQFDSIKKQTLAQALEKDGLVVVVDNNVMLSSYNPATYQITLMLDLVNVTGYRTKACPVIDASPEVEGVEHDGVKASTCLLLSSTCGKGTVKIQGKKVDDTHCVISNSPTECCFSILDGSPGKVEYSVIGANTVHGSFELRTIPAHTVSQVSNDPNTHSTASKTKSHGLVKKWARFPAVGGGFLEDWANVMIWTAVAVAAVAVVAVGYRFMSVLKPAKKD